MQREIKVSRDGTELEPGVGRRLIEEWDRPDTAPVTGRAGQVSRSPPTGNPPGIVPSSVPRGRGRGRGFAGGG